MGDKNQAGGSILKCLSLKSEGGNLKDLKIQRWFLPYKESFELPTAEPERHK